MHVDDLFAVEIGSQDLDRDVAAAAELVSKIAEEQGLDLNDLSDLELAQLSASASGPSEPSTTTKQASVGETMPQQNPTEETKVSMLDVTRELTNRAAVFGIDITSMTKEAYDQSAMDLAARMADMPTYERECMEEIAYFQKRAAEEEAEKVADEESGRRMARGFHAELRKIAEEEAAKEETDEEKKKREAAEKEGGKEASAANAAHNIGQLLKHAPGNAAAGAKAMGSRAAEHVGRNAGKYTAGGALAVGGAGFAAGRASKKDKEDTKEASDRSAAVLARAEEYIKSSGLDPAVFNARLEQVGGGEKVAAEIDAEAQALLTALGYEFT